MLEQASFHAIAAAPDPVPRPLDHLAQCGNDADVALVLRAASLSWHDLRSRVERLAGWLAARLAQTPAATPGRRVATWAAKGELSCLMPLAAARAGLVHVPINPLLKRLQVAHILADCQASLLLANEARLQTLAAGDLPAGCASIEESEALAKAAQWPLPLPPSRADPGALAAILYTSGSTGRPKGVMLSHANMWLGAVSVAHYLGLARDDVTLGVLPLSFDYGQNQMFSTWYAGGAVVPMDYLVARDVIKACAAHKVTTLAGVPPLWVQLAGQEWPAQATASLRRLTNSGGALGEPLVRRLRAMAPEARLFAMYGLTEAFRSTFLDPALIDAHPTSIGREIPFAEVLVVDEAGQPAQQGELVHCGPLVAQGYWGDPERTAARFRPAPPASRHGGVAVWSGDQVRRDEDGLLYFIGRRDGLIKSAGNRISPQEIEEAAISTGLAEEAVAFGVADERLGQAIHLAVRGSGDGEALARALRAILPVFQQPARIFWVDSMPISPNGKIDRAALEAAGQ